MYIYYTFIFVGLFLLITNAMIIYPNYQYQQNYPSLEMILSDSSIEDDGIFQENLLDIDGK